MVTDHRVADGSEHECDILSRWAQRVVLTVARPAENEVHTVRLTEAVKMDGQLGIDFKSRTADTAY